MPFLAHAPPYLWSVLTFASAGDDESAPRVFALAIAMKRIGAELT